MNKNIIPMFEPLENRLLLDGDGSAGGADSGSDANAVTGTSADNNGGSPAEIVCAADATNQAQVQQATPTANWLSWMTSDSKDSSQANAYEWFKYGGDIEFVTKSDVFTKGPRKDMQTQSSRISFTPHVELFDSLGVFATMSDRNQRGDNYYSHELWGKTGRGSLDRVWLDYKPKGNLEGLTFMAGVFPNQTWSDIYFDEDLSKVGGRVSYQFKEVLGLDFLDFSLEQTTDKEINGQPSVAHTQAEVYGAKTLGPVKLLAGAHYRYVEEESVAAKLFKQDEKQGFWGEKVSANWSTGNDIVSSITGWAAASQGPATVLNHQTADSYSYSLGTKIGLCKDWFDVHYVFSERIGEHSPHADYADDFFNNAKGPRIGVGANLKKVLGLEKVPGLDRAGLDVDMFNPTATNGTETVRYRAMFSIGFKF